MSNADREDRRRKDVARTGKRLDRAQERLDRAEEQMERRMQDAHRQMERARERIERGRGAGGRGRDAEPIWARPQPGARNPRFSREEIAAKALEIADREGLESVSMRRLAAELGAGTMTLYHYVANKQELFDLMHDAMMGELLVEPERLESGWREALTAIAIASRDTWRRHRWMPDALTQRLSIGPKGMRHFDQSLEAVASTGLELAHQLEVVAQVDDYVAGFVQREQDILAVPEGERGEGWEERLRPVSDYLREQLATGDYPHVAEFIGDDDLATVVRRLVSSSAPEERFNRGLERLLDGVQLEIERSGAA